MELHNPKNLGLPPLLIEKQQNRAAMEKMPDIKAFIGSRLLLSKDFYTLFTHLAGESQQIESAFLSLEKELRVVELDSHLKVDQEQALHLYSQAVTTITSDDLDNLEAETSREFMKVARMLALFEGVNGNVRSDMGDDVKRLFKEERQRTITRIGQLSHSIVDRLVQFQNEKQVDVDFLTQQSIYLCKHCGSLVSRRRFRRGHCDCGIEITKSADVTPIAINTLSVELLEFIANRYWFEYGIEYLLKRKSFQTLCGFYILGHSAMKHEIDVIAEMVSQRLRFLCECKTAEIGANDVFIFAGKMDDIGCSRGYMFTLTPSIPREISFLARSKNISIVVNVLERPVDELLNEITEAQ